MQAWIIVFLLFLIQVVNYFDKTVMGLAAKPIMAELGIDKLGYGLIASSFFSLYAVGGLLVGFLVAPRVRPRFIIMTLLLVWSLVQLPIVLAASFSTLVACRTLLGFGEGGGTPSGLNACHEWFDDKNRNFPSALVMFGSIAGSLVAAPVLSYIIALFGWRAAFLACAILGAIVLVFWVLIARDGPHSQFSDRKDLTPSLRMPRQLLLDRTVVGLFLVGFCAYYVVGFAVSWLAPFVTEALGADIITTGWILSAIFAMHAVILLSVSLLSQVMMKRGASSRTARGIVMALAMAGTAIAFVAAALITNGWVQVVLIGVFAAGLPAIVFPLNSAMLSEIAPTPYRNQIITIVFSALTFSALISPSLTGWLVSLSGGKDWTLALMANAIVAFAGAAIGLTMLHPARSAERLRHLA